MAYQNSTSTAEANIESGTNSGSAPRALINMGIAADPQEWITGFCFPLSVFFSTGLPLMPVGLKNISEKNWARLLLLHQCTIPS